MANPMSTSPNRNTGFANLSKYLGANTAQDGTGGAGEEMAKAISTGVKGQIATANAAATNPDIASGIKAGQEMNTANTAAIGDITNAAKTGNVTGDIYKKASDVTSYDASNMTPYSAKPSTSLSDLSKNLSSVGGADKNNTVQGLARQFGGVKGGYSQGKSAYDSMLLNANKGALDKLRGLSTDIAQSQQQNQTIGAGYNKQIANIKENAQQNRQALSQGLGSAANDVFGQVNKQFTAAKQRATDQEAKAANYNAMIKNPNAALPDILKAAKDAGVIQQNDMFDLTKSLDSMKGLSAEDQAAARNALLSSLGQAGTGTASAAITNEMVMTPQQMAQLNAINQLQGGAGKNFQAPSVGLTTYHAPLANLDAYNAALAAGKSNVEAKAIADADAVRKAAGVTAAANTDAINSAFAAALAGNATDAEKAVINNADIANQNQLNAASSNFQQGGSGGRPDLAPSMTDTIKAAEAKKAAEAQALIDQAAADKAAADKAAQDAALAQRLMGHANMPIVQPTQTAATYYLPQIGADTVIPTNTPAPVIIPNRLLNR